MADGHAECGTEGFTRFVGMDCTGRRAVGGDFLWRQRGQGLHSVMTCGRHSGVDRDAGGAQQVAAVETQRGSSLRHTGLAHVVLAQQLPAFHQRRHDVISRKAVSNVLQAFTFQLLWFHDGAAAERTLCLSL